MSETGTAGEHEQPAGTGVPTKSTTDGSLDVPAKPPLMGWALGERTTWE